MARVYASGNGYGAWAAFGTSFLDGLVAMQRLDLQRDEFASNTEFRRRADARASELQGLTVQERQLGIDAARRTAEDQAALPGSIADVYRMASGQAPVYGSTDMGTPGEPDLGAIQTTDQPGRAPAATVQDLIQRGVDPATLSRVQRLNPKALEPLGLQTPEQAADRARKDKARDTVVNLLQSDLPSDLVEQGHRLGQITGALVNGGFITGNEAIQRIQDAYKSNPAAAQKFFGSVKAYLDGSASGSQPPTARLRDAFARALGDDPTFIVQNPALAKDLGFDKLLAGQGSEPKTVTALPHGSPGAIVGNQFVPVPQGVTPPPTNRYRPGSGGVVDTTTGEVKPWPDKTAAPFKPRNLLEKTTMDMAEATWPGTDPKAVLAKQTFMEELQAQRDPFLNQLRGGVKDPNALMNPVQAAIDKANHAAYPEKFAGTAGPTAPVDKGWARRLWDAFWHTDDQTSAAAPAGPATPPAAGTPGGSAVPRGRPEPPPAAPPAAAPSPTAMAPPGLTQPPPGAMSPAPTARAVPPEAAPTPPLTVPNPRNGLPQTLEGTRLPQIPGKNPAQPPPSPNYSEDDMKAEAQRLIQAGVPPNQVRAAMKAAGW